MLGGVSGLLVGGLPWHTSASAAVAPPTGAVPRNYFGLHIHRADTTTPWPEVPFGSWRLWDTYTSWPHLQPEPHRWDFRRLDTCVSLAERSGVSVLLPLGLSPAWASARPEEPSSYRPGNAAEPARLDDWRRYVRTVVERYKGRISHYEVWNEINLKGFYSGSLDTLLELARIAHQEIRSGDPAARIVSPSVTGLGRNPQWLDRYLSLGGGQYADVIGYHFYSPKHSPEAMLPVIRDVQASMRRHGVADKPLWNTEAGWWIQGLAPAPRMGAAEADWRQLDQATAQSYVARALLLGWAFGVSRYYWYAWDNLDMGLYDSVTRTPKPAARAYARTASWLTDRVVTACTAQDEVWTCELLDPDKKRLRIVWRESDDEARWPVPAKWNATDFETLAGETGTPGAAFALGPSPVLLR
ncbi:MAG: hypothetical protein C0443_09130 [Comamonadaceae bacterium]|nr:hypothetical protein [Comamonadaceae bacterium]